MGTHTDVNRLVLIGASAMLALLFLFGACSSVNQVLDNETYYKRDLVLSVDGQNFSGTGVLPEKEEYDITVSTSEEIALLLIRSCNREVQFEKVKCSGLFSKTCFHYKYVPVKEIEKDRVCPVRFEAYRSDSGKHQWGILDFKSSKFQIPFKQTCNGVESNENGVGFCQGRMDSVQALTFEEPVRFAEPMPNCEMPHKVGSHYEVNVKKGECLYTFDTRDGKLGRFLLVGYDGILVRETQ